MTPAFSINISGVPMAGAGRLLSLSVTDNSGEEADQLDIELSDHDNALALPRRGVSVSVSMGWADDGLVDKGSYIVDEVSHSGSPDRLKVSARAANFHDTLKTQKDRSWHAQKLGAIIQTVAGDHGLVAVIGKDFLNIEIEHIDQTSEGDLNFVSRLAKRFDALCAVKESNLLFVQQSSGSASSGAPLTPIALTRLDGDQHSYSERDRDTNYTGVRAFWQDKKKAKKTEVIVGDKKNMKTIRQPLPTETEANKAANAEFKRLQRNVATMSLNLALGRPELIAESPVSLSGWKPEIDSKSWILKRVVHRINGQGFTSSLQMETAG